MLSVYPSPSPIIVRQRLSKHVPTATNTHTTTESSMQSVSIKYSIRSERKVAN
jgi:hypothetical protein